MSPVHSDEPVEWGGMSTQQREWPYMAVLSAPLHVANIANMGSGQGLMDMVMIVVWSVTHR